MGRKRARRAAPGGGGGGTGPQSSLPSWPPALLAPASLLDPHAGAAAAGAAWFGSAPLPPALRPPRGLVCGHLMHAARYLASRPDAVPTAHPNLPPPPDAFAAGSSAARRGKAAAAATAGGGGGGEGPAPRPRPHPASPFHRPPGHRRPAPAFTHAQPPGIPTPSPPGGGFTRAQLAVVRAARAARKGWAEIAALVGARSAGHVRRQLAADDAAGGGAEFARGWGKHGGGGSPGEGGGLPGHSPLKKKVKPKGLKHPPKRRPPNAGPVIVEAAAPFSPASEARVTLHGPALPGPPLGGPRLSLDAAHGPDAAARAVFFPGATVTDRDDPSVAWTFRPGTDPAHGACFHTGALGADGSPLLSWARLLAVYWLPDAPGNEQEMHAARDPRAAPSNGGGSSADARPPGPGTVWAETRVLVDADDLAAAGRAARAAGRIGGAATAGRLSSRAGEAELFLRAGRVHSRLQNVEHECWLYRGALPPGVGPPETEEEEVEAKGEEGGDAAPAPPPRPRLPPSSVPPPGKEEDAFYWKSAVDWRTLEQCYLGSDEEEGNVGAGPATGGGG